MPTPIEQYQTVAGENGVDREVCPPEFYAYESTVYNGVDIEIPVPKEGRARVNVGLFKCAECGEQSPVGEAVKVSGRYYCTKNGCGKDAIYDKQMQRNPMAKTKKIRHTVPYEG